MPKKFDVDSKDILMATDRYRNIDVHRVLATIPILTYHVVADVGCGPGFFTIPLAKYLFDGRVYALDVQQKMLDATNEALEKVHLTNVDLVRSKENKFPLEDDSLDGALIAFLLQEANSPTALLKEVKRCLRKSGWLAILEWYKEEMEEGPPAKRRIAEDGMRKMTDKLGFRFTSRQDLNPKQYMLVMRK